MRVAQCPFQPPHPLYLCLHTVEQCIFMYDMYIYEFICMRPFPHFDLVLFITDVAAYEQLKESIALYVCLCVFPLIIFNVFLNAHTLSQHFLCSLSHLAVFTCFFFSFCAYHSEFFICVFACAILPGLVLFISSHFFLIIVFFIFLFLV